MQAAGVVGTTLSSAEQINSEAKEKDENTRTRRITALKVIIAPKAP